MLYTFWTLVVYCTASGKVLELAFSIFLLIVYLSAVSMSPWPLITKDLESIISWKPETDYLGNHVLSSEKFKKASGWTPKISLDKGIQNSWTTLINLPIGSYNPLKYLNDAKEKQVDLTEYY